jgi:peptidoglycan/LPS O-acetylase OafA/YrhL
VWSIAKLNSSTPFPGMAALFPVGGKLSYSWYLWHWPLLILAPAVAGHALGLWPNLGLAAAAGLLALATVKLVEDPVRFSSRLRARPGRSLALGERLLGTPARQQAEPKAQGDEPGRT